MPLTTADMPGSLSAVVFCQGCPWRCRYCHNSHLIALDTRASLEWNAIVRFLERRVGLLDAVVFSGGEPTMQPALSEAMREVRALGFRVGLHTAGQYPRRLEQLLELVDWVGMDVKAPSEKYTAVTGRSVRTEAVRRSIEAILSSGVECEFRTTIHSDLLCEDDIRAIARSLSVMGAPRYVVQLFRPSGCVDQELLSTNLNNSLSSGLIGELESCFESFEQRGA